MISQNTLISYFKKHRNISITMAVAIVAAVAIILTINAVSSTSGTLPVIEETSLPGTTEKIFTELKTSTFIISELKKPSTEAPSESLITTTVDSSLVPPSPGPSSRNVTGKTSRNLKCSLGSISYDEFHFDSGSSKSRRRCWNKRKILAKPDKKNGDRLDRVVCEDKCAYYSAKITNFNYPGSSLVDLAGRVKTVHVAPHGSCPAEKIPQASHTQWKNVNWLQIELQSSNECSSVYEMVSTWEMPKLNLIFFNRPYFSISNQEHVRGILQNNENITSLSINEGIMGIHVDIFNEIQLPKLTKVDIRWNQEFNRVINQTKALISNSPLLKDLSLSLDLTLTEFIWISKKLKNLRNGQFSIFLPKSPSENYQLSLSTTIGFDAIENLTLVLSVEGNMNNKIPINITDFQFLNPSLKCLTIMTKGPYSMNIDSESEHLCSRTHSIRQNGQLLLCCRY